MGVVYKSHGNKGRGGVVYKFQADPLPQPFSVNSTRRKAEKERQVADGRGGKGGGGGAKSWDRPPRRPSINHSILYLKPNPLSSSS